MTVSVSNEAVPLSTSKCSVVARQDYRPDIDGLRAIAALAVVGIHAGVLPGGFVGVDIFFVISGYLISGLILRALSRGSFSSIEFYARRVKRIFPALITLLIAASILGWLILLSDDYRRLGRGIAEGAGFVYNLDGYWHTDPVLFHAYLSQLDLGHLWSLGVEEQFYLLWPLFLMFIWKLKRWQLRLIVALTLISFTINVVMVSKGMDAYSLPWTRLWQLSLGGAFAYMQSCRAVELERLFAIFSTTPLSWLGFHNNHLRGLLGAALILGSCVLLDDPSVFPGWGALAPTIGSLLIITAGTEGWVNRYVLSTFPLVSIGLISYPVYLWHYIMVEVPQLVSPHVTPMMMVAAVLGTFLLSFLTYKYIELPLRYSRNKAVIPAALCGVMLACGIAGYAIFVGDIPARSMPGDARKFALASMEDWLPAVHSTSWTRGSEKFITIGTVQRSVLYVGDSDMQQYFPRIAKILADHPLNSHGAVFAVRDWCAPVESHIENSYGATSQMCMDFMHRAFEYARAPTVDAVVISACWSCYLLSFDDSLDRFGRVNTDANQALESFHREIQSLVHAGKRVYVVLGIPMSPDLDPRSLIHRIIVPPGFRVVISSPERSELEKSAEPIKSTLIKVSQAAGASVIDPMQSLCDETVCSPVSANGDPVYRDWFDLSPSYVRENVRFLDSTVLDAEVVGVGKSPSH